MYDLFSILTCTFNIIYIIIHVHVYPYTAGKVQLMYHYGNASGAVHTPTQSPLHYK